MESNYGQLIVHLINKDKLPDFKTTLPYWCTEVQAKDILINLELEGNSIDKKKVYFRNKHFKY